MDDGSIESVRCHYSIAKWNESIRQSTWYDRIRYGQKHHHSHFWWYGSTTGRCTTTIRSCRPIAIRYQSIRHSTWYDWFWDAKRCSWKASAQPGGRRQSAGPTWSMVLNGGVMTNVNELTPGVTCIGVSFVRLGCYSENCVLQSYFLLLFSILNKLSLHFVFLSKLSIPLQEHV